MGAAGPSSETGYMVRRGTVAEALFDDREGRSAELGHHQVLHISVQLEQLLILHGVVESLHGETLDLVPIVIRG